MSQALTMSLTSTSSDSEQVSLEDFLESCRAPTLLAELDDDEEIGDNEDENDDDENEDDADYEEVCGRGMLAFFVMYSGFLGDGVAEFVKFYGRRSVRPTTQHEETVLG